MSETNKKVGDYWSKRQQQKAPTWNWWTNRRAVSHINRLVCGETIPGASHGLYAKAAHRLGGRKLRCGISVGCGTAQKEMDLLAKGIVDKLVCYELSETRIATALSEAARRSLSDRIEIRSGDAFEAEKSPQSYDLVFWNNALHHMSDVTAAVEWSRSVLASDGMFLLDDYVGPNRIQFSDLTLELGTKVRQFLPAKYLAQPGAPDLKSPKGSPGSQSSSFLDKIVPAWRKVVGRSLQVSAGQQKVQLPVPLAERIVRRPDMAKIVARDPSEAPDSESILAAIARFFPAAEITRTGGTVYFATLPPLYANFDPSNEEDNALLDMLMLLDELHVRANPHDTLYATALAYST